MNIISRFSATLMAGVDKTVSQIENHDAVVEASLKETQKAAARAKVRLQRVQRDGQSLRDRQAALKQKIEHWTERARQNHVHDKPLALECVGRRKHCLAEEQSVQLALNQHAELERQLSQRITSIEKRVSAMSQQRNQLRSREATAEALRIINRVEGNDSSGIDDAFERWDMSIIETEISAGSNPLLSPNDELEAQFSAVEQQAELESELEALLSDQPSKDTGAS